MSVLDLVGERFAALSAYRTHADPPPIKLDANESPWALPDDAREDVARALADAALHRYPDLGARRVRAALAARLGCEPDALLCGVGSDEVIGIAMRVLDRPRPDATRASVLYPTPGFVMYPITARVHGLDPVEVPLDARFRLDVPAIEQALRERRPNLVFLASPNNPTGNAFADDALEAVIAAAPDALVVIDEAYAPFSGRTLTDWVDRFRNVAVMGTLSKIGLAGLRLGWLRARPELIGELEKARPPYNLNGPSQLAAALLLESHADALDAQVRRIVEARGALVDGLEAHGVCCHPTQANFVLIEHEGATELHAALLERGIAVRRFAKDPRLARHLRITVGTPDENTALLEAVRSLVPAG